MCMLACLLAPRLLTSSTPTPAPAGCEGAHVLIRYLVHPGVHRDFIDTWQEVADTVGDQEEGNRVYNLRKVGWGRCYGVM
jgi:hypothetical protein